MAARIASSGAVLIGVGIGAWGIVSSMSGLPGFSPRRNFISELAVPDNPLAERFNTSLEVMGLLVVCYAVCQLPVVRRRTSRAAARLTVAAGLALFAVGFFPVTRMWPHLVAAIALGATAIAASAMASVAARRATRGADPLIRRLGVAATATTWLAAVAVAGLVVYFLWVSARVWPGSVGQLFRQLPRVLPVEIAGTIYNPLSVLEWLLFAAIGAQLVGFAAAELSGLASRVRQLDRSG